MSKDILHGGIDPLIFFCFYNMVIYRHSSITHTHKKYACTHLVTHTHATLAATPTRQDSVKNVMCKRKCCA